MHIEIFEKFSDFTKSDWSTLSTKDNPCLSYDFIENAEITGCVSNETGWRPRHLALFDKKGSIKAALLLMKKLTHGVNLYLILLGHRHIEIISYLIIQN